MKKESIIYLIRTEILGIIVLQLQNNEIDLLSLLVVLYILSLDNDN